MASSTGRRRRGKRGRRWLWPVLRVLFRVTVSAIFVLTLACVAIYCAGSLRGYPDERQFSAVRNILFFSTMLGVASLCGALLDVLRALVWKRAAPLSGTLGYLAFLLAGLALAMGAGFILSVARGNLS